MRDPGHVITGSKRKRAVSSNENAHTHGRPTRGSGSKKRARTDTVTAPTCYHHTTSEESQSDGSEMDVDGNSVQEVDSDTSEEEGEEEKGEHEENDDSCTSICCSVFKINSYTFTADEYLINFAPPKRLSRLLKVDLVRLYESAGLPDDGELFTKSEIIDALVNNRDDHASVPPSSPPGRPSEVGSSEESSDDGNFAGDEETDVGGPRKATNGDQLRRRVTLHEIAKTPARPMKSRSLSMGNILGLGETSKSTMVKRKASTTVEMDQAPGVSTRFVQTCMFLLTFSHGFPDGGLQLGHLQQQVHPRQQFLCPLLLFICALGMSPCPSLPSARLLIPAEIKAKERPSKSSSTMLLRFTSNHPLKSRPLKTKSLKKLWVPKATLPS